jgi:hypothetical protein
MCSWQSYCIHISQVNLKELNHLKKRRRRTNMGIRVGVVAQLGIDYRPSELIVTQHISHHITQEGDAPKKSTL